MKRIKTSISQNGVNVVKVLFSFNNALKSSVFFLCSSLAMFVNSHI